MSAATSAPPTSARPFGVARKFRPAPTVRSLLSEGLHVVATGSFRPRGGRYDVRPLRKRPARALRGGPDGLVAAFAMRDGNVEISILARCAEAAADDVAWAMDRARGMAAVDDDPSEFLAMAHLHPLVLELSERFDCRIGRTPTVFEAFARAVIEQLVTTFEAHASIRRLFWAAGELVDGTTIRAAPTARAVLEVPPWRLHAMGIGSRRSRTLREGAHRGAALERLRALDPELAAQKLESLPGVGPWTANLVARTALGWSDAVPVRDCHAHYVISEALTGEQGDDDAMLEALAPFRPHRARVVRLITQAQIAGGLNGEERGRYRLPRIDPHRREPWKY
jgi:3-methyladenine DNA glycosylase/8-oxoguanine DNA glycosylase